MDRLTSIFWIFISVLFGASIFFGVSAGLHRNEILGKNGKIESGAIVRLIKVIDGDTVLVEQEGQNPAHVRIMGIKSFDAKIEKDTVTAYGKTAVQALERGMAGKPVRVMLYGSSVKDRYGRYVATLYVDDYDVGLRLIQDGLVVVYTVYPFPAMTVYLQAQEGAKSAKRGLWADRNAAQRAKAMMNEWQRQSQ